MFPIRDHNPSGRTPYVTYALITLNIVVFFVFTWPLLSSDYAAEVFFDHWGLVPLYVVEGHDLHGILTSMFLHGGVMHLIGNMLFLHIFGDNMEDEIGHVGYLAFYLACGLAAAALQILMDPYSRIPMVGASGAIAGVMGGYLLLFPKARVDVFLFFVVFFKIIPVRAWLMLGLWFLIQIGSGVITSPAEGGVAHWAHTGGFIAGVLLTLPLWLRLGGRAFWDRTQGLPPHPETYHANSRIPIVRRRR